jgi:rhodanese-related sulfurtransferase
MARSLSPSQAREELRKGAQLADVRERAEWDAERLEGGVLVPMSGLPDAAGGLDRSRPVLTLCTAGVRAAKAAGLLEAQGFRDVAVMDGGLDAWKAAGLPVVLGRAGGWTLEMQVRLGAGLLTLAGAALGALVHPGFFGLCAFVGAGLTFAALTGYCGMAFVLLRMPWNRSGGGPR